MHKRKTGIIFPILLLLSVSVLCYWSPMIADGAGGGEGVTASGNLRQTSSGGRGEELPELDIESWELMLVNADKPFYGADEVVTAANRDGYMFDARAVDALDEMLEACRAEGLSPALASAWRSTAYQQELFENKVGRIMAQGYGYSDAQELAATEVAPPGTSEHHTGLAADIVSENYGTMDEGYEASPEAVWLREHCAEYGFVLRYPKDKQDVTGIIYEPWHFRYVGVEAAAYMTENGLVLEEFVKLYDWRSRDNGL